MANEEQNDAAIDATEGGAGKKKFSKAKLIKLGAVAVGVLIATGVALYFFMNQTTELTAKDPSAVPDSAEPQVAEESAEPQADETTSAKPQKTKGVEFGCTFPLKPFNLNLGNPLENRYIRLEISVEFGCSDEQKSELGQRIPQLRDAIINVTGRQTREMLLSADGKAQLRKEIHGRINHYMKQKIDDVFITDILIE